MEGVHWLKLFGTNRLQKKEIYIQKLEQEF